MEKNYQNNICEKLIAFMQMESSEIQEIEKFFTLETFVDSISHHQITVPSRLKLKLFRAFKHLLLRSFDANQQPNNNQNQQGNTICIDTLNEIFHKHYEKILSYLILFIDNKLIFLPNSQQWNEYIELISKLVLGSSYHLELSFDEKERILVKFVQSINERESTLNQRLKWFIEEIRSSDLLNELLISCSKKTDLHKLFKLCFIILVVDFSKGPQKRKSNQEIISTILDQIFLDDNLSNEHIEFYFHLLEILHPLDHPQSSLAKLYFKISKLILIQKINRLDENSQCRDKKLHEIQNIKFNLKQFFLLNSTFINLNPQIEENSSISIKLFQLSLTASFLIGENLMETLDYLTQIDVNDKILTKIIGVLKISDQLTEPLQLLTFCKENLSFINKMIKKFKQNPSKGLKFIDHESNFSVSISSECQVNFKIKTMKSKDNLVLLELVAKNKRIEIVQKTVDSKFTKIGCLQYVKNEIKCKQVEQLFDFQPTQQFSLYFQKSKVKLYMIKKINDSTQNLKLLQIERFESFGSKINIGMGQGKQSESKNVQEIQKFIISSQSIKRDKTELIQKTNIFKIAIEIFQRNGQSTKFNDAKIYGLKMNNVCVKNYQNDFELFAEKNHVKLIALKTLKKIINGYFKLKYQNQNKHLESQFQSNFNAGIKETIQLLKNIEQERTIDLDDAVRILIESFLENFDRHYQDNQSGCNLLSCALKIIKILSTQSYSNFHAKYQSLTMKFFASIINCSISIFICFIDFFQQKFLSDTQQSNKNTLQLFRTIIFQSVLLISDPKVFKQQKTHIIDKIDSLLTKVQQHLSHRKLKFDQINDIEETLKFFIGILKNDKYENENHQKMRRFKLSYMLIKFLKNCFSIIKFDAQMGQNLFTSSHDLCMNKIQHLKTLILKDEETFHGKTSNQSVTTSTEIINSSQNVETFENKEQANEESIILSTKQSDVRSGNQALKDKIFILSGFLDLYYTANLLSNQSIQKFESSLEGVLKFMNVEQHLIWSGFTSQLLNKSWVYYFKIFQQQFEENKAQNLYIKSCHILEKLTVFGFQYLFDNTIFTIVKSLVFQHRIFYTNFFNNERFYERLTGLDQFLLKLIKDLIKKSEDLDDFFKSNIEKTLVLVLLRAPICEDFWKQFQTLQFKKISKNSLYLHALQIFILAKVLKSLNSQNEQNNKKLTLLLEKNNTFATDYRSKYVKSQSKNTKLNVEDLQQKGNQFLQSLISDSKIPFDKNLVKSIFEFYEELLLNFVSITKTEIETKIQRNMAELQLEMEKSKSKLQKQEKQKQLKRLLKRDTSAKQLFAKVENKKDLKLQMLKEQQIFRSQQPRSLNSQLNRRVAKNTNESKILFSHIQNLSSHISFIESGLLEVSNLQITNLQNDKIFLTQKSLDQFTKSFNDFDFSVDDYCDKNGLRMMLCKKNPIKKMPKIGQSNKNQQKNSKNSYKNTLENLKIIKASAEAYSNELRTRNPDIKHLSKRIQDMMPMSPGFRLKQNQVGQYVDAFKVTLITNSQFHQGQLRVYNYNHCDFVESKEVDLEVYHHLAALEFQQRKKNEIIKNPLGFQIKFDLYQVKYIRRKYLKVDNSIEIFAKNKSYFLVFRSQKQRDNFTSKIQEKAEINQQKIHKSTKMWQKGAISNFDYLMELNKYSDRSFNDISQYYVFPWTVTDSKCKTIDDDFMKNPKNFRDLNKPIGKINDEKFAKIKSNFENTKRFAKNPNRPQFLYSSFYSNPAIVSYYLIRLYPFSAHQYELQSQNFDQADRLFGSIESNYNAVFRIPGDFKELIPQFYCNPYFLKNLNRYDFGMTQEKGLIDNVKLPAWVRTQTPEQFVFRMRNMLQSSQVTENLHKWIDLTFGMCAQKSKAEKYENLYNENVYGENLDTENPDFISKYLKQFGQIPRVLFQTQHPKSMIKTFDKRRMLKKSKSLTDMLKEQLLKPEIKEFSFSECEKLNDDTEQNLIKFNRKNTEKEQKDRNISKQSLASVKSLISVKSIKMNDDENSEADEMSFLLIKQNILIAKNAFGFGYFNFSQDSKDPLEYKNRPQLFSISKCDVLTIQDIKCSESYFLTIQNSILFGHKLASKSIRGWKNSIGQKFQIETKQQFKLLQTIGSYLVLVNEYDEVKFYVTETFVRNKKSKTNDNLTLENINLFLVKTIKFDSYEITDIEVNEYLSILSVKVDQDQFIVFDVRNDLKIDFRMNLKIDLSFEEKITKVQIHNMGYFFILTNKNRFVLINLLGQIILNIMVNFDSEVKINKKEEEISTACFWSQQSSNLLFCTNIGILYKVDLFDMAQNRFEKQNYCSKFQKIRIDEFEIFKDQNQNLIESYEFKGQQKIVDMKIQRRGRHWKLYCLGRRGNIYILKNKYFEMAK